MQSEGFKEGALMKEFIIYWANGQERVFGKDLVEAVHTIRTPPDKILTGYLVRLKEIKRKPVYKVSTFMYWDAEQFWKELKKVR